MRSPITKARLLTSALVLVNTCVLGVLLDRIWYGTQATLLLATAPKPFAVPELDTGTPMRAGNLGVIQDQPLFYASRHFYIPPPPSAVPAAPPKPDYRLVGTFIIPSKPTVALLTGAGGASRKVKTGDELDGWTVQAVETGRVVLQYQATTVEISSAGKGSGTGMQVVSLGHAPQAGQAGLAGLTTGPTGQQTAQATPSSGGIRVLGAAGVQGATAAQGAGASASRSGYLVPNSSPRLYRPPPK